MQSGTKKKSLSEQGVGIERQTYTIEEAAKILGICRTLAYRVLPTVKIGGRRLVTKATMARMLGE